MYQWKVIRWLLGTVLTTLAVTVQASVTYQIKSASYSEGDGPLQGVYTDSMMLSGQLTLSDDLPVLNDFTSIDEYVVSYSFTDGVNTYNQGNSFLGEIEVITDGNGIVTNLFFDVYDPAPPYSLDPPTLISGLYFEVSIYSDTASEYAAYASIPCTELEEGDDCAEGDIDAASGYLELQGLPVTFEVAPPVGPVDLNGSVQTPDGDGICALVLASGEFVFSCDPAGEFSLSQLPREEDGTVKRQIYADGFFPRVDVLNGSSSEVVVMQRSGECLNYNMPYAATENPESAGNSLTISGRVLVQATDMPLCALVLANGEYVFSCNEEGSYELTIPLDDKGQYKLQVYADGHAPSIQVFDEAISGGDVRLTAASECN